jgi:octopine/nopaline transport system permease protein
MSILDGWWDDFFFGLVTVLQVFSVSLAIAVVCGLLGASAKLSKSRGLRGIAQAYTWRLR